MVKSLKSNNTPRPKGRTYLTQPGALRHPFPMLRPGHSAQVLASRLFLRGGEMDEMDKMDTMDRMGMMDKNPIFQI